MSISTTSDTSPISAGNLAKLAISPYFRKAAIVISVVLCLSVLVGAVGKLVGSGQNQQSFVFYTVNKTDLPIVVTERGNLESQVETSITCNVENVSERSGNSGTQIIFIVPNGSAVEKDDLLVEFDSATIRDRLDTQTLAYQKAISARLQAVAKFDNQLIQNETTLAEAKLAIELAEIEREMYVDKTDGTFQLAVEEIERSVDDAKNATLEARAALELAMVDRAGMKELFKLGYRGKSDLDQSRLKYLQAEDKLASSVNRMKTYQANRRKLTRFEREMEEKRLQGAVDTAIRTLKQVINDNQSLEEQALAAKNEAVNTEEKEQERLERMKEQLVNSKIYAPHDGMVVYARDRRGGSEIFEGAIVRERQRILTLPDLSRMKVKTQVHEAVLDQVRAGLPASVRVDAFPDRVYRAVVDEVGVVPASRGWGGSGSAKTYETIVRLVDEVESLKPGMTAVVNIHVDQVKDVLAVPVQAIIQAEGDTWCYVESGNSIERRDVKIGRSNDKFVHIQDGLAVSERVVLNSMDIFDQQEHETIEISPDSGVPAMPDSLAEVGFDPSEENAGAGRERGNERVARQRRGPRENSDTSQASRGRQAGGNGARGQVQRGEGRGPGRPSRTPPGGPSAGRRPGSGTPSGG